MDSPGGPKASFGFVAEVEDGVSRGHFNYVGGLHINGDVALVYFVNAATHTNQDMFGLSTNCGETQPDRPIR